jgi:hypothetical protein
MTLERVASRARASAPRRCATTTGRPVELEGSVAGRFSKSRASVAGTWTFKLTFHDAAGAVTDTCDSGTVNWRAKQ